MCRIPTAAGTSERERKTGAEQPVLPVIAAPAVSDAPRGKVGSGRKTSPSSSQTDYPSFLVHSLLSTSSSPPLTTPPHNSHLPFTPCSHPHAPNIFNYIFSQVLRLSNQGADIDACADKSANTGNKINKDFEERVTANFAQWSAPHSRVRFLIERATPENSCSAPQKGAGVSRGGGWVAEGVVRHLHFLNCTPLPPPSPSTILSSPSFLLPA